MHRNYTVPVASVSSETRFKFCFHLKPYPGYRNNNMREPTSKIGQNPWEMGVKYLKRRANTETFKYMPRFG